MASLQADGYGSDEQGSVLMSGVLAGEEVTVQPIARKRRRLGDSNITNITKTIRVRMTAILLLSLIHI